MPRYRHQDFIDAAAACFRRYGYFGTRMEGVAAELGCSKVTLYQRFPDKTSLAAAWLTSAMAGTRTAVAAILEGELPFADKVRQVIERKQHDLDRFGESFTRDLFSERCPAPLRRVLREQSAANKAQTRDMMALGRDSGAIDPGFDDGLIELLLDHFERLFTDPAFITRVAPAERVAMIVRLFLHGVGPAPATGGTR